MVGRLGELTVDAEHGLPFGDDQASEILGEVPPLAFVAEEVAVRGHGVLHDLGKIDDSWHEQVLLTPFAPGQSEEKWSDFTYFNASGDHFAKHQ